MKKRLLLKVASIVGVAAMLFTLTACPPKDPCKNVQEPQDNRSFSEQVRQYLTHNQGEEGGSIVEGHYVAYFDLSDGLVDAYFENGKDKETDIYSKVENVTSKVSANINGKWEAVYGLEAGEIKKLGQDQTFNTILRNRNSGILAPIEGALEQIVKDKKPALLVTDFEEYTKDDPVLGTAIIDKPYAAPYFHEWVVNMKGVIKFYVMDYTEKQLSKKLFIVVFDSKNKELINTIDLCMRNGGEKNYEEYELPPTPYKVFTDYSVGKGGNYIRPNGMDPLGFEYAPLEELNTETYTIPLRSWLQSVEELMCYRNNPDENFTGVFSKLYVDFSDSKLINIDKLTLRVTDITNDFNAYTRNTFARGFAPTKGEDGQVGELTCEQQYFYDANGELLSGYQYVPSTPNDFKKFFKINEEIFDRSRSVHPEKTEIVIDFDENFTDTIMFDNNGGVYTLLKHDELKGERNGRILKVDVCIAESGVADYSDLGRLFNFKFNKTIKDEKNKKTITEPNVDNKCITNSIQQTLQEIQKKNLGGRVIYTYIIKDNPDAE